ncbi:MAG: imelysin family protein [Bacteroidota bacterium]
MKKLFPVLLIFILLACEGEDPGPNPPDSTAFDRKAMLMDWADNIIIPGYTSFSSKVKELRTAGETFATDASQSNLEALRTSWEESYLLWQRVSMFNIGKADELRYRDNLNIYPSNVAEITENITQGGYNLSLPSQNDRQGFPALDYLLFGLADSDEGILDFYTRNAHSADYKQYVIDLVTRIDMLTTEVLEDWTSGGFRESFIENSGNSATASVDLVINDFVFYYEKNLRAGKVGIPAGVFSGNPLNTHVEALYKKDLSKELLQLALQASQDFFNGKYFNATTEGEGMKSYLDFLNSLKGGEDLSSLINNQFNAARSQIQSLGDNFAAQIESDNIAMLSAYDQLQLNVVLLKVDMLQAFNINVDYVDADGD